MLNASPKNSAKHCPGHTRHVQLANCRARNAQNYPAGVCCAILRGLRRQLQRDGVIDENGWNLVCDDRINHVNDHAAQYYDDISGDMLDTKMVEDARKEELAVFKAHGVYKKVPLQECIDTTGKKAD